MIILTYKFKSRLPAAEGRRIMRERAPLFRALPGLAQKYYGHEPATGMHTGIYVWESKAAMRAFREGELAASIPAAYQVEAPPRVEVFELIMPLRDMPELGGRA